MKYTARHVRRFIDQGKIDPVLWKNHFPTVLESRVPECKDCEDHKNNLCQGGREPVDCFLGIQAETEANAGNSQGEEKGKKKSKQYKWNGPTGGKTPKGANKIFDQSKM